MTCEELTERIKKYRPFNEQEEADKVLILDWIGNNKNAFSRENTVAHETDLLAVAIREVREEAGIANVYPVSEEIFSLESLTVDGHVKKGKYVSSHLHLNITYLLEADPEEHLSVKEDENSGVAWFTPEEALEKSTEPWFVECVYKKLIKKTHLLKGVRMNENEVSTE